MQETTRRVAVAAKSPSDEMGIRRGRLRPGNGILRSRVLRAAPFMIFIGLGSCSHKSPLLAPNSPNIPASYAEPAWNPGGNTIVFSHTPLIRRYNDPKSNRLVYEFAESL